MKNSQKAQPINQKYLKEVLSYDSETGAFTWIKSDRRGWAKKPAGTHKGNGYIEINLNRKIYKAHRLAWLYVYGELPKQTIDHINGTRNDNRICNLRDVSQSENVQNIRKAPKNSSHGLLGVSKHGSGFCAKIQKFRKSIWLGTFQTPELAHEAYLTAKRELHEGCTI